MPRDRGVVGETGLGAERKRLCSPRRLEDLSVCTGRRSVGVAPLLEWRLLLEEQEGRKRWRTISLFQAFAWGLYQQQINILNVF